MWIAFPEKADKIPRANFAAAPGKERDFAIGLSDAEYEGVWQWGRAYESDTCEEFKYFVVD